MNCLSDSATFAYPPKSYDVSILHWQVSSMSQPETSSLRNDPPFKEENPTTNFLLLSPLIIPAIVPPVPTDRQRVSNSISRSSNSPNSRHPRMAASLVPPSGIMKNSGYFFRRSSRKE